MSNDQHLELIGEVIDVQRNGFVVRLDNTNQEIFAKLAGKLRHHNIEVLLGDRVTVKVSVYDTSNGLISIRHKK